jgi:hypothetical protein
VFHLISVREEPLGQFTAEAVGIPEARATAATRAVAIQHVTAILNQMLARGVLVVARLQNHNPLDYWAKVSPDDPMERAYREELDRARQEDLELQAP